MNAPSLISRLILVSMLSLGSIWTSTASALCAWEVTDRQTGHQAWLIGSVHMLPKSAYPLPEWFPAVWDQASEVSFETDMQAITSEAIAAQLMGLGMSNDSGSLRKTLGDELYAETVAAATPLGLPEPLIATWRPWLVATMLTVMTAEQLGYQQAHGLEQVLMDRAIKQGKSLAALESVDKHIRLLAELGDEEQRWYMQETLADLKEADTLLAEMVAAWKACDENLLVEKFVTPLNQSAEFANRLLYDRNERWVKVILESLKAGAKQSPVMQKTDQGQLTSILYVVGAAHLVGAGSVVELLEQAGLILQPLHRADSDKIAALSGAENPE